MGGNIWTTVYYIRLLVRKADVANYLSDAFSLKIAFTAESSSANVSCFEIRLRRSADWMAFCRSRIWSSLPAVARARSALPPLPFPHPRLPDHFRPVLCKDADERCNPLSSSPPGSARRSAASAAETGQTTRWWLVSNHSLNTTVHSRLLTWPRCANFNHFFVDMSVRMWNVMYSA